MPVVQRRQQVREPTLFEKIKMGAIMGGAVGSVVGIMVGSMTVFQYGPGPKGYIRTVGQYVAGSASMLGLFMAIGSVIRNDDGHGAPRNPEQWRQHYLLAREMESISKQDRK